jgi:hypothetical protein
MSEEMSVTSSGFFDGLVKLVDKEIQKRGAAAKNEDSILSTSEPVVETVN